MNQKKRINILNCDMTLYLEEGSVLLGSGDLSQYPIWNYSFEGRKADGYASLLNAGLKAGEQVENLTLEGTSSAAFWPGRIKYRRFPKPFRGMFRSLRPVNVFLKWKNYEPTCILLASRSLHD